MDIKKRLRVQEIINTIKELAENCQHLDYTDTLDGAKCNGCGQVMEAI